MSYRLLDLAIMCTYFENFETYLSDWFVLSLKTQAPNLLTWPGSSFWVWSLHCWRSPELTSVHVRPADLYHGHNYFKPKGTHPNHQHFLLFTTSNCSAGLSQICKFCFNCFFNLFFLQDFGDLVVMSFILVTLAAALYTLYVYRVRKHIFHFEKLSRHLHLG